VPRGVQKRIGAYNEGLLPKNKYLVELQEKLHLKALHGRAGGRYNQLFKDAAKRFGEQMRDPALAIGFAAGAMRKLGLGDAKFIQ
jgi:hypothetical protein